MPIPVMAIPSRARSSWCDHCGAMLAAYDAWSTCPSCRDAMNAGKRWDAERRAWTAHVIECASCGCDIGFGPERLKSWSCHDGKMRCEACYLRVRGKGIHPLREGRAISFDIDRSCNVWVYIGATLYFGLDSVSKVSFSVFGEGLAVKDADRAYILTSDPAAKVTVQYAEEAPPNGLVCGALHSIGAMGDYLTVGPPRRVSLYDTVATDRCEISDGTPYTPTPAPAHAREKTWQDRAADEFRDLADRAADLSRQARQLAGKSYTGGKKAEGVPNPSAEPFVVESLAPRRRVTLRGLGEAAWEMGHPAMLLAGVLAAIWFGPANADYTYSAPLAVFGCLGWYGFNAVERARR